MHIHIQIHYHIHIISKSYANTRNIHSYHTYTFIYIHIQLLPPPPPPTTTHPTPQGGGGYTTTHHPHHPHHRGEGGTGALLYRPTTMGWGGGGGYLAMLAHIYTTSWFHNIPPSWFQNPLPQPQLFGFPWKTASKSPRSNPLQVRLYAPEFFQSTNKFQVILDVLPLMSVEDGRCSTGDCHWISQGWDWKSWNGRVLQIGWEGTVVPFINRILKGGW